MRNLILILTLMFCPSANAVADSVPGEKVSIYAKFDGAHFQHESSTLEIPLHFAGYETEWTNEEQFKRSFNPKAGTFYNIKAEVISAKPGSLIGIDPGGQKEYGAGYLMRYLLKITSAEEAENNRLERKKGSEESEDLK